MAKDTFLGHPKGLYVLALTEMWERFSFYGMKALLVFFLIGRFGYSDAQSFATYGTYTALVYLSPILGGLVADRYLGFTKSVTLGAVLMTVGHAGLALDDFLFGGAASTASPGQLPVFHLSLACLIVGVGLLKPNISAMVGELYPRDGYLRDSGFTVFVWGINFGATISALLCGYLGQTYGWGYGFGLAGVGILLGLSIFLHGQKHLRGIGVPPDAARLKARVWAGLSREMLIYAGAVLCVILVWPLSRMVEALGYVVGATFFVVAIGILFYGFRRLERVARHQLFAAVMLMTVWVGFVALVEQTGSSISLFTERVIDRKAGALEIRSAQLQALLPFLVIALSPVFAWLWGFLERRSLNPSTPTKFAWSLLLLGVGYGTVTLGALWPGADGRLHIGWLVSLYFFFAVGDLLIVPVGLSAVTKLAARSLVGLMMGLWMLSVAIGNFFAASIAKWSALDPTKAQSIAPLELLAHYQGFFAWLTVLSVLLGVVALACTPWIRRSMHGVR
ncbi:MAG: oligopeptide:H+ symporter [Gammaproteobacteria bacterium]